MKFSRQQGPPDKMVAVFLGWYEPRLIKGIARYAKEKHWSLLFDYAQMHKWSALPERVDGLLCLIGPNREEARFLREMNVPIVVLSESDEGLMGDCPHLLRDEKLCGQMAAEYFLSLRFVNFLTVGKKSRGFFRKRIEAFVDTIRNKAKTLEKVWIGESLDRTTLRDPITAALKQIPKPVAVFVPSDVTCVHVMHCALGLGLQVPEEVAILGVNNEELICDYAPVALSSIDINFEEHGYKGAALLDRVMRGHQIAHPPKATRPSGVIVRQSTNILAVPDVQVAKALRFIWANVDRPLPAGDVAAQVGLSQNALGLLFRKHLQTTIVEEIARSRIDKAKTLLTSGNLKAKDVARACGFGSANYFNNLFRAATGMTPRKFRLAGTQRETTGDK